MYIINICKPLFLLGWPLSEGLSFGSEVGCGGVVSMDEPSSVGGNGLEVTDGVGSINVEDRVVSIGSAVGKHLDAFLLLHKYSYNNSYNLWHTYFQCDEW